MLTVAMSSLLDPWLDGTFRRIGGECVGSELLEIDRSSKMPGDLSGNQCSLLEPSSLRTDNIHLHPEARHRHRKTVARFFHIRRPSQSCL